MGLEKTFSGGFGGVPEPGLLMEGNGIGISIGFGGWRERESRANVPGRRKGVR